MTTKVPYIIYQGPTPSSGKGDSPWVYIKKINQNFAMLFDSTVPDFLAKSADFTSEPWVSYLIDTSANVVTSTLPGTPERGQTIEFYDIQKTFAVNGFTISRNGQKINGVDADITFNDNIQLHVKLKFVGGELGWMES